MNHCHHTNHDHAGHSHGLTRSDEVAAIPDSRLLWAVVLNQILTVAQVIAGIVSGSTALLSDAAHNFSDANALLIAYAARRISRRKANADYTFGYRQAEMIGALINLTLLGTIGIYLVYEAIHRLVDPKEIIGWLMAATSALALVIDLGTAILLWAMSRGSLNVRAAFVHNLVDAFGSLAVLVAAGAVIWLDWTWVDPAITLLIAAYILYQVYTLMPQAIRALMQAAPSDLDMDGLIENVNAIKGVDGIHHVHVWQLDEQNAALEAHVVIAADQAIELESIKGCIKKMLAERHDIDHSTLEFELEGSAAHCCLETRTIVTH
ncbi:Cadmium, cobalt and zinc/H(+)-K(+) antiporter [Novipirellula aureliae]|uniref:Cadmium, cobalt and zinc/H(+)-K(+) antiporter n=1 Tax=Novipirellula aureliae TaxID=2527966 RepID=A0A5C6E1Q8_9BACT|nr:cation diffusion facilitator family transporter [Novipirellula aureliae]TWU41591.1 Cadmium, cobalt and zinc/H(+)-K(+) antiporter [Novipirellula aureliae]